MSDISETFSAMSFEPPSDDFDVGELEVETIPWEHGVMNAKTCQTDTGAVGQLALTRCGKGDFLISRVFPCLWPRRLEISFCPQYTYCKNYSRNHRYVDYCLLLSACQTCR